MLARHSLQMHCHQVLFNQLISWVGYGTLIDPHREFFIQSASGSADAASGAFSDSMHVASQRKSVDSVAAEHAWNTQCVAVWWRWWWWWWWFVRLSRFAELALAERCLFLHRYTVNVEMLPSRYGRMVNDCVREGACVTPWFGIHVPDICLFV